MLRTHCQTSGVSLHRAGSRTTTWCARPLKQWQRRSAARRALHTNSFDEAIALPTALSARIARNTQTILADESEVTRVVDPLGGSYFVERLTQDMADAARGLIDEVERLGGMTQAIAAGMPMRRIEESSARRQARIERGEDVIVGVNKYPPPESEAVDARLIDNSQVRAAQVRRLSEVKSRRDQAGVDAALAELIVRAESGGNLLAAAIDAANRRATVGEITGALESAWGRHGAEAALVPGVYSDAYGDHPVFRAVRDEIREFADVEGRRPRIFVAKVGQDGHDRGAKAISNAFNDLGFSVELSPLFLAPAEAADRAAELGVDVVGVSTLAGAHKTLVPELMAALDATELSPVVICGGVIPERDHGFLRDCGVRAIYGPGTNILEAASAILKMIPGRNR